jgi:hypothetical protein
MDVQKLSISLKELVQQTLDGNEIDWSRIEEIKINID